MGPINLPTAVELKFVKSKAPVQTSYDIG